MKADDVLRERPDNQPTGEVYCELAMTGAIVASVTPLWRHEVASFLRGLLSRVPLSEGRFYEPHRAILGALLLELDTFAARDADRTDLRDFETVRREAEVIRGFQAWAEAERARNAADYHAHIDGILAESTVEHAAAETALAEAVTEGSDAP